jgi:hypothetical protein
VPVLLLLLTACAAGFRYPGPLGGMRYEPRTYPAGLPPGSGDAIAQAAAGFVGERSLEVRGQAYRFDCSGLVEASLASARCPHRGSSAMLWEEAVKLGVDHRRPTPAVGDVAFFDDTYDRNRNGRVDDPLSHTAIVESVASDGTITLVHVGSAGVVRFRMNLRRPHDATDERGHALNDALRVRRGGDPAGARYLAGELWVGFAGFARAPAVALGG